MDGEMDFSVVISVIVIITIIAAVIYAIVAFDKHVTDAPFKKQCENNPKERYAQQCVTYEECITLCTQRLKEKSAS